MSKIGDFQEALRSIKAPAIITMDEACCAWLDSEINRLQGVAKQALLDQRAAEADNKEYKRIERLQALATTISFGDEGK